MHEIWTIALSLNPIPFGQTGQHLDGSLMKSTHRGGGQNSGAQVTCPKSSQWQCAQTEGWKLPSGYTCPLWRQWRVGGLYFATLADNKIWNTQLIKNAMLYIVLSYLWFKSRLSDIWFKSTSHINSFHALSVEAIYLNMPYTLGTSLPSFTVVWLGLGWFSSFIKPSTNKYKSRVV